MHMAKNRQKTPSRNARLAAQGAARGKSPGKTGNTISRAARAEPAPHDVQTDVQTIDERIWLTVSAIPRGRIATYGDVARRAGLPGAARRVGAALRKLPGDTRVPWHRVVNAAGKSSLAPGAGGEDRQRARLADEGVLLERGGPAILARYRWH